MLRCSSPFFVPTVVFLVVGALATTTAGVTQTGGWTLDEEQSLFAVVTHKEGVASGLAHEHLVVAGDIEMRLQVDLEQPTKTIAEAEVRVDGLEVDDPALNAQWQSELLERELISEEFASLGDKDRQKIRRSMLSKKQLDAETHPMLRARLDGVSVDAAPVDGGAATATLHLEIRGQSVAREIAFEWPEPDEDGAIRVDASQSFTFRDFGIKPYSALLGAIRVADEFDVVLRVVARPSG